MAKKGKVFNRLGRPKLLRKKISASEAGVGVLLLLAILGMTIWLIAQRDNYDPGERDIDTAVLVAQSVEDNLYKTPLKRWRDPSLGDGSVVPVDVGPFAPSLLVGGWRSASTPQVFVPDTLYEKINGQAEQYLKFGFEKLTVVELEHPGEGRTLDVFLYDQGSFEGSLGLYEEQRGDKPVVELEGVRYTPNVLGAIGMSGRTFFHVIGDAPAPSIQTMTERVLTALAERGEAEALPPGFQTLSRGLGVPFARIGYQPTNVFQYRFAQQFWFARVEDESDTRWFVHAAVSPAAAEALFDKLQGELVEDYERVDSESDRILFRHKFLQTYFGLMRDGAMVFGVEKHPEREGAQLALDRLRNTLEGEKLDGEEPVSKKPDPVERGGVKQDAKGSGYDESGYDESGEGGR